MEKITEVELSTREHPLVLEGLQTPARVTSISPYTCIAVCDGTHRISGNNGLNFTCDMRGEMTHARSAKVSKVLIPKVPNLNSKNNSVTYYHELNGTTPITFTLDYGYYNQTSFVNEIKAKMDASATGLPDTFIINYEPKTHTISIQSSGGYKWYFSSSCSFIVRGINMAGFVGLTAGLDPAVFGSVTTYSSSVSFVYTRYVTIESRALSSYVKSQSRDSNGQLNIIGAISTTEDYDPADYDTSGVFGGNIVVSQTLSDTPKLPFSLKYGALRYIDFLFRDEFGDPLYEAINISPSGVTSFGAVVWLELEL